MTRAVAMVTGFKLDLVEFSCRFFHFWSRSVKVQRSRSTFSKISPQIIEMKSEVCIDQKIMMSCDE